MPRQKPVGTGAGDGRGEPEFILSVMAMTSTLWSDAECDLALDALDALAGGRAPLAEGPAHGLACELFGAAVVDGSSHHDVNGQLCLTLDAARSTELLAALESLAYVAWPHKPQPLQPQPPPSSTRTNVPLDSATAPTPPPTPPKADWGFAACDDYIVDMMAARFGDCKNCGFPKKEHKRPSKRTPRKSRNGEVGEIAKLLEAHFDPNMLSPEGRASKGAHSCLIQP